ncbi:serine/threonine-protein phosphatase 2A activator isoform X3 [Phyllopteryx taeniolatus]|uniref:serine/threonine-protein phosphatase 2A activator isoform X3 n=1 Tax=Phyllopteryx taeniolatus TaxID=161469 RepID=UPI002AD58D5A|nr:serine/threonine-protein phosphatase 2A activator isoform X3 [Phyllopteryx taeniolatus]XP_061655183.1 serine/threonine-protein phosphatase 2A activator isoform X3 [Phyllopteryx taeniolatus]
MAESEQRSGALPEDEALEVTTTFTVPKKEIAMVPDMGKWKRSKAYADYMGFILTLNESVKAKKLTCVYRVSETVEKLLDLLGTLDRWINETPPADQPSRFGNKAFRTWFAQLDQEAEALVSAVLPADKQAAAPEIAVYLKESVGNSTRIDYGTGHEAAFAAFLCCLCKVGALKADDQMAIVFKVFNKYLSVMRKLQRTYRMEPAGSQGVWGLDDFQFLPFIWGSSQFVDHPTLEPRHFVDERVVNEHQHDYMFLECIKFINELARSLPAGSTSKRHEDLSNNMYIAKSKMFGEVSSYPALQIWEPAVDPAVKALTLIGELRNAMKRPKSQHIRSTFSPFVEQRTVD